MALVLAVVSLRFYLAAPLALALAIASSRRGAQKPLVLGGISLAVFGMLLGLIYLLAVVLVIPLFVTLAEYLIGGLVNFICFLLLLPFVLLFQGLSGLFGGLSDAFCGLCDLCGLMGLTLLRPLFREAGRTEDPVADDENG